MQKLVERNTFTPTDIPHVRGNCDPVLKALRGRSGVPDLKTSSNNSDAALTGLVVPGQNLRVSVVKTTLCILNKRGKLERNVSYNKLLLLELARTLLIERSRIPLHPAI